MTRRCSHCSNNGHNSRTCPARGGGVRLFGVRLVEGVAAMKKSASVGCLPSSSAATGSAPSAASPSVDQVGDPHNHHNAAGANASGYASDDPARTSCSSNCRGERKRGIPWTEDEHRMFLMGLQKLGKGDWRGIARNFVVSRTPTQVASHAQKYFIRQSNASRRKRRSSLFDMAPEMPIDHVPAREEQHLLHSHNELESNNMMPSLDHAQRLGPESVVSSTTKLTAELREINANKHPVAMIPMFYPTTLVPVPMPLWISGLTIADKEEIMAETHKIVSPSVNLDEVVGMSKLQIGAGMASLVEPTALSLSLLGSSNSRQPAFHANPPIAVPDLNQSNSNPIHAV